MGWTVAALAVMLGAADSAWAQQAMWQGYANAAIAAHARRAGGQAPREARKTCEGDINGDGRPDAALLYTIEGAGGGTGWTQFVLVMVAAQQGVGATNPKEVGASGKLSVESCTLSPGVIEAVTKEWAAGDPACCPSKPGTLRLGFDKGKVVDAPVAVQPTSAPPVPAPHAP